jgi:RND superfamily putative drug exporter
MSRLFAAWGGFVHRRRWLVLASSGLLLAISIAGLAHAGSLVNGYQFKGNLEYQRATDLINRQLPAQDGGQAGSSFLLLFSSSNMVATDPGYQGALETAVAPLRADSRVLRVDTPYTVAPAARAGLVSRDGHEALALVSLRDPLSTALRYYPALRSEVAPSPLSVKATGTVAINQAFNSTLESDLRRAELVSLPVTLVLLLLIFASAVAALLPLGVGVLTILGGLGGTLLLANVTDVSQYALNVVTLIGLGVSVDYSLFVVNRFREEMARGISRESALANTLATAGRAITFSGLTVAVGLSALLFYQGTFMASMGLAGAVVVGIAVVYGLTFLPALLAIAGPRIDSLRLPWVRRPGTMSGQGLWGRLAGFVMRRPVVVLMPAVGLLLLAGTPFLGVRLANGDVDQLPPSVEARQAYDALRSDFPGYDQTSFDVVVHYTGAVPSDRYARLSDLSNRLGGVPGVLRVTPGRSGPTIDTLTVVSSRGAFSDGARDQLKAIRAQHVDGAQVLVTGDTAFDVDTIGFILSRTPMAIGFVVAVTLFVLFLLTGSVVLPIKAVLTNLVSISASFGALVWIFQQGHLSGLLGFTAQSTDPTIPVILFAVVFGVSMDYEVLLVSRIQEEYQRTGDTVGAVARGLARTGRLITGAAAVMVAVFLAFGLAQVELIKAIGIGLAIAIAIDATVVRGLIVPAVMRLLGSANWWAPAPLRWLHQRAGISEVAPAVSQRDAA